MLSDSLRAVKLNGNQGIAHGTISFSYEIDQFIIEAQAGQTLWIRVADISNAGLQPKISLQKPDGTLVESGPTSNVATITTQAGMTGSYTIKLNDKSYYKGDATGDYDLHYAFIPGANECGELLNGEIVTESITIGDLDSYTFTANAGDSFTLQVSDLSGGALLPRVSLYDPKGNLFADQSGDELIAIPAQVSISGTYTVIVSDQSYYKNDATGEYTIEFWVD